MSYCDFYREKKEKEADVIDPVFQLTTQEKQQEFSPKKLTDPTRLPPIANQLTAVEKENYFGPDARSAFFDYYHHLSRQRLNFNSESALNSPRTGDSPRDSLEDVSQSPSPRVNVKFAAKKVDNLSQSSMDSSRSEIPVLKELLPLIEKRPIRC